MIRIFNEVLGKEVVIPEKPLRIISLSPAITETLFLLGMSARIVGVSAFCARPVEAREKRKVGSYSTSNIDLLRKMKPDLILTITGYQRDLALKLSEEFPVYPLVLPVSVPGIIDTVAKVGLVVGEQLKGCELVSKLMRKMAEADHTDKKVRVYVEIDLGGPVSFGAYSYIVDALHYLGASTLYDEVRSEWLTPDLMEVVKADPDMILYEAKMYSKFDQRDLERLIEKRAWRELYAVKNKSYFLTPGPLDFLAHHGPCFITEAIPWLSQKLATVADNM